MFFLNLVNRNPTVSLDLDTHYIKKDWIQILCVWIWIRNPDCRGFGWKDGQLMRVIRWRTAVPVTQCTFNVKNLEERSICKQNETWYLHMARLIETNCNCATQHIVPGTETRYVWYISRNKTKILFTLWTLFVNLGTVIREGTRAWSRRPLFFLENNLLSKR